MSQHHLSAAGTGMEEDENVLKTALAFVVLRQRVAHKLAATRGSRDIRRIQGHGRDRDHRGHMCTYDQHQEPLFESSTSPSIVTQMSNGNSHSRSFSNSNTGDENENGNGDGDGNEDEVENGNRVITNTNRLKRKFPESTGIGNDNDVIDDIDDGNSNGNSNSNSNSTGESSTLPFLRRIHINEIGTSKADAFINNANGSATGTGNKTETEAATMCTKSRHISTMFRIALSTAHSLYVPYVCKLTAQIEEEGEEQAHSHETESEMQMQMDDSETNSASTSTSTPVSSISDSQDIHIEASTNTGDDCDDYGGGSGNSNEHDNLYNEGHGHERVDVGIPMPSTFYDYKTASWTRDEIQTQIESESESESHTESLSSCADYSSAHNAAATYNALDRILMNLASDLNSFISHKHQHQYRQETDGIDCSHGIVYSLFMAPLVDKLFGRNSNSGSGSTDGKKPIQIILTMCTILHRLVFLDSMTSTSLPSNLVDDIIISISKMLQTLYYHDFPPWTTSASFTDGSRTGDNGNSNWCGVGEVINGGDVYAKLVIQLPDILAVNCLVLLEEIVSLKLSKEVSRNYDDHCNGDGNEDGDGDECMQSSESDGYEHRGGKGDGYEYHGGGYVVGDSLSEVAGEILNILTVALGELILPIPVQEMSSFYIRDMEEMDDQMKRDFNLYSRLSRTYGNQNQYESEGKSNLNVGHLNSGAKIMLRLSLFNIVQKLSSSHIGDIHL